MGATGRSIMLKIGVYTVSQPAGVWKFVAPRSEIAPGGVPRSSGTINARARLTAVSRDIDGCRFMNATSSFIIPMLPTGSTTVTEKIASHFPSGVLKQ